MDRIALTDHNTAEGALRLHSTHPDLVIVAEEVRTMEGEIVALFISETITAWQTPEEVLDQIREMGGLAYVVHPFDRRRANFDPARLADLAGRIDIIETYNPWADDRANAAAADFAEELGLVAAWGSDAHGLTELGQSWMEVEPFDGPGDFLKKLRRATFHRTPESGRRRRA